MQGAAWIALMQQIPESYHDKLTLVTVSGTEICLNVLVRLEDEYMLIRGRLAGTTDTGRAFFIPYDQITYLGFQQSIPEAELRAIYGDKPEPAVAAPAEPTAVAPEPTTVAEGTPATAEDVPAGPPKQTPLPEPVKPVVRTPVLGKNSILERLRARSHTGSAVKPGSDK